MHWGSGITNLGSTTLKEKTVAFGIKDTDRTKHLCVLGRAGSGRGDLLVSMALQDIARGLGVVLLDATGMSSSKLLERLPEEALERVVFLDPSDAEYPFSYNIVDDVRALSLERQATVLGRLLADLYQLSRGEFVTETARIILEKDDTTLITFHSLVTDKEFRDHFFGKKADEREAFEKKLEQVPDLVAALENDGKYVAKDTLVRNLLGQHESKFNLRGLSEGQIVIVDLSRIRMYPTRMAPVARLLVNGAHIAAEESGTVNALYLHDIHRYLNETELDELLSPASGLAVALADTLIQEADLERRLFTLSRCASILSFAAHPADEEVAKQAFYPFASQDDLVDLPSGEFIIALAIDGVRSKPFFAKVLPLPGSVHLSYQDLVVASRQRYTTPRGNVDRSFKERFEGDEGDDDNEDAGTPRGFQDAFRSIFAKQAERAKQAIQPKNADALAGSSGASAKTPPQQGPGPAAAEGEKPPSGTSGGQPISHIKKGQESKEVDEDTLRQLLYVAPVTALLLFAVPLSVFASVVITEVMYDVPGTDVGREWIEVQNTGSETLTLDEWKFFENNTNHALTSVSGGAIPPGGYAVIADNSAKFLADWPSFSGILYDSSFSLGNSGELLVMRNSALEDADSLTYDPALGAAGDGNSLQKNATAWSATPATPGAPFSSQQAATPPASPPTAQSQSQSESSQEQQTDGGGNGSAPPVKNIFADAGPDRTVIVGADSAFLGSAIGLSGEPLENARFTWSFGNGDRREGENVLFHFLYPGTYTVILDVTSGQYSASDRAVVQAVPADISIAAVTDEYIALKNKSSVEVDLGGWMLSSLGTQFRFPQHTILASGREIFVSNARTGLSGNAPETVALLYPNGMVATTFKEPLFLAGSPSGTSNVSAPSSISKKPPTQAVASEQTPRSETVQPEELLASPAVAATNSDTDFPVFGWLIGVAAVAGACGAGAVWLRRKNQGEYSIREINENT